MRGRRCTAWSGKRKSSEDGWQAMVNQVRVSAILMIVHGVLIAILALGIAVAGLLIIVASQEDKNMRHDDKSAMAVFSVIMLGFGALSVVIGALHVAAGIMNLRFRGRILAIVALCSNVVVILSLGLCSVVAIAMMV
jgi:hypothetical protein